MGPAQWSFTFGATALANATIRMVFGGDLGMMEGLAIVVFVIANIVVAIALLTTLLRFPQGSL